MTAAAARVASTGFGAVMAALPLADARGLAADLAIAALAAVLIGSLVRPVAALAVLLVVVVIALGNTASAPAAICGLCAVGYLVLRHTAAVTAPTVLAAAGFAAVGLVAAAFPLRLPWLPLIAPLAAFGCYLLAIRPFLGERG